MSVEPRNTLDVLLKGIFDYAGMYPPASRSFEEALKESATFPTSLSRPWMVGSDLVIDAEHATRLHDADLRKFGFSRNIGISYLASDTPPRCLQGATRLISGKRKDGLSVSISSMEAKVSMEGLTTLIDTLLPFCRDNSILLAFEPDLSSTAWEETLGKTIEAIRGKGIALKCRCTGPTGISADRLATAIISACDSRSPFKVTAGLHHPIVEPERYDNKVGFLNLATAVMIRRVKGEAISKGSIASLLTNQNYFAIKTDGELSYQGAGISVEELHGAKNSAHFSIGSCSLHEPDADLTRLSRGN
jgi:hypothetical protein